jgi:hypothetical protein
MTFDDLKQMEGQIIDYYEVKGNSIKAKKGKIRKSRYYGNDTIDLKLVDKLGRCQEYIYHTIYYGGHNITKSNVYDCGYVKLYLDKEEAYNYVIENLRKQRQSINKKMLKVQMELYGKKMEIKNEG